MKEEIKEPIKSKTKKMEIPMFSKISIGDPMYFKEETGDKLEKLVYKKEMKEKSWVGSLQVFKEKYPYKSEDIEENFEMTSFSVAFAPNKEFLKNYELNMYYKNQKKITKTIGVDTATYCINKDNKYIEICTGGDGYWGEVTEYYNNDKLEGITINMFIGDIYSFEEGVELLKNIFS